MRNRIPASEQLGCRDCAAAVPGKKYRYCEACAARRQAETYRRYEERNAEKRQEYRRARWQVVKQDPELRGRKLEHNRAHYARNREAWAERTLRDRHGMTKGELYEMWITQESCCYLCERPLALDEAVIDHDHACCGPKKTCPNCRRGLAHNACNQLIGLAEDSGDLLRLIAANLDAAMARKALAS